MGMVSMVVGGTTHNSARFVAKVDTGPVRVAVADNAGMSGPVFTSSVAVDSDGVAKLEITGLSADTRYWWQVEDDGVLDTSTTGQFVTYPTESGLTWYEFAAAGDAGATNDAPYVTDRQSNHPVFDRLRALRPLFFMHSELHYRDIGSGVHESAPFNVDSYRDAYDDMLSFNGAEGLDARQGKLYREVPLIPTWDNHDYGFTTGSAIDSDRTLPHRDAARQAFRERMPHYDLPAGSGDNPIYYSFRCGPVLYVVWDVRSERDPNSDTDDASKTMLGSAQKAWLDNLLETSDASALCVYSAVQWIARTTESDTWNVYRTEQEELVQMFGDHGWLNRMWMVTANMHAIALDDGSANVAPLGRGGFPVMLAAALDSTPATASVPYSQGVTLGGRNQFGRIRVLADDDGARVRMGTFTGGTLRHRLEFTAGSAPTQIRAGNPSHVLSL